MESLSCGPSNFWDKAPGALLRRLQGRRGRDAVSVEVGGTEQGPWGYSKEQRTSAMGKHLASEQEGTGIEAEGLRETKDEKGLNIQDMSPSEEIIRNQCCGNFSTQMQQRAHGAFYSLCVNKHEQPQAAKWVLGSFLHRVSHGT